MNAVTRDRARIREAIGTAPSLTIADKSFTFERNQPEGVYVLRSAVLAALTDNIVPATTIPVHCGCTEQKYYA